MDSERIRQTHVLTFDRATFLLLASSVAGCQLPAARSSDEPETDPEPVPVATILVEPAPPPAASEQVAGIEPEMSSSCRNLPPEDECPGEGVRTFCQRYESNFNPAVAAAANKCLASLPSAASCSQCGLTQCGLRALEAAQGDIDPGCRKVESKCQGMGALCELYAKGLNEAGRARFRSCLVDNCGIGVRYCLWDPSATPCTEGGGGIDFQF